MYKLLILTLLVFPAGLRGQVFQRPFEGAGSLSLGGATVAFPKTELGLTNEALLGYAEKTGVWSSAAMPFGLTNWQNVRLQAAFRLNPTSGLGLDFAQSGIEIFREQRLRLGYGRRIGKQAWLGGGFDYLRAQADEYGVIRAVNFGLGAMAKPFKNLCIGLQVHNPLSLKINDFRVPGRIRFGVSWVASATFMALSELEKDDARPASLKFGFQYQLHPAVAVRLGFRGAPGRASFGAGFKLGHGFSLDFASEWHPVLGITPVAGFVWRRQ